VYEGIEDHFYRAITGHGHTMSRTEVTGPLLLELGVIPRHLDQVIHDLTHRKTLIQIDKLLEHDSIMGALEATIGKEYARLFRPWLQGIAQDRITPNPGMSAWHKMFRHVRVSSTVFTLGLRATTLGVQPLGHANAIGILRKRLPNWKGHYARGMAKMLRNPMRAARVVRESSGEMRFRLQNIDRDLRDVIRQQFMDASKVERAGTLLRKPGVQAMRLIGAVQFYAVDLPVWMASYEGALTEHGLSDTKAVEFADAMVRMSQSSGSTKDLSSVQRQDEMVKLWTTFFSYQNVVWNQIRSAARETHSIRDVPAFLTSWALYLSIPAIGARLLRDALSDDRDEDEERWRKTETWLEAAGIYDFLGLYPFVTRQWVSFARYGSRPSTPMERLGGEGAGLLQDIAKEDVNAREILFDGLRLGSIAAGLPTQFILSELEQELKERE